MKNLPIYILFSAISLCGVRLNAQQDSVHIETKTLVEKIDSLDANPSKYKKAGDFFVGVDLYSPVFSAFSDRKGFAAFASYRVYKKWNAVLEIGYEKNNFTELDWNVEVNGMYYRLGFNWFVSQDPDDKSNGFFTGMRFGFSSYQQEIKQYPIRFSNNQVYDFGSLPKANVSAYWLELVGGARVKLVSNLYADVAVKPQIYLGSKKQENIDPLVIPGYGRDTGPMNFNVIWGLSWKLF